MLLYRAALRFQPENFCNVGVYLSNHAKSGRGPPNYPRGPLGLAAGVICSIISAAISRAVAIGLCLPVT